MVRHYTFNVGIESSNLSTPTIILVRRWDIIDIDDLIFGNESAITSER